MLAVNNTQHEVAAKAKLTFYYSTFLQTMICQQALQTQNYCGYICRQICEDWGGRLGYVSNLRRNE